MGFFHAILDQSINLKSTIPLLSQTKLGHHLFASHAPSSNHKLLEKWL
jgi:hypothetical protein